MATAEDRARERENARRRARATRVFREETEKQAALLARWGLTPTFRDGPMPPTHIEILSRDA